MSDPRICIVGAGNLSTRRIYPYIGAAGAVLAGVCDLDVEKASRNARRFGGKPYRDMATMLDDLRPDGCIVCVGPEEHGRLARLAIAKGCPVYTEKPPALSAEDAARTARAALAADVLCVTAFKKRYAAAYRRAKEWIAGFAPEDVQSISIDYASAAYANDPANPRSQFLADFCIHAIDLVRFLLGDPRRVCAFSRDEHAYAVCLEFPSGAVGTLTLSDGRSFTVPTEEVEITARGGNFMTVSNSARWRLAAGGICTEWREPPTFTSSGDSGNDTGHLAELADFVEAVRTGRRDSVSHIADSCRSMALYEAIRDSARTGAPTGVRYPELGLAPAQGRE